MKPKKYLSVDLEKYSKLFFKLGLIIALALVYMAFNWQTTFTNEKPIYAMSDIDIETEYLPPVVEQKPELPKPKIQYIDLKLEENSDEDEPQFMPQDNGTDASEAIHFTFRQNKEKEEEPDFFYFSEVKPKFPGGDLGLMHFLKRKIKYPVLAVENGIEGKVFIRFSINKKGEVINPEILRSVDSLLDKEAIRVVKLLPKWKPGMNNGRPVSVKFTLPVTFKLNY